MDSLPREVLRWIQSLDLSSSVKNIKRDFSNGYLVAEILSRYFPKDVFMHSFNSGICLSNKSDNWKQLLVFFRKFGFRIENEVEKIQNIIRCNSNDVIIFLTDLYQFLTARKVSTNIYIKPKRKNNPIEVDEQSPEEIANIHHFEEKESKYADVSPVLLSQQESLNSTAGFNGRMISKVLKGDKRRVGREEPQQQVKVKDVHIKQVNGSISKYRLPKKGNHHVNVSDTLNMSDTGLLTESVDSWAHAEEQKTNNSATNAFSSMTHAAFVSTSAIDILNTIVGDVLPELKITRIPCISYCEKLESGDISSDAIMSIFEKIQEKSSELTNSVLSNPVQYESIASIIVKTLFHSAEFSNNVKQEMITELIKETVLELGHKLSEKDSFVSCSLFCDFMLPQLFPLYTLIGEDLDGKKPLALITLEAHCPLNDFSHLKAITCLRDKLLSERHVRNDSLILCLSSLLYGTTSYKKGTIAIHTDVVDLYKKYALAGISSVSGTVRAASFGILRFLINAIGLDEDILSVVNCVEEYFRDSYWETRAQIILICTSIINHKSMYDQESQRDQQTENTLVLQMFKIIVGSLNKSKSVPLSLLYVQVFAVATILDAGFSEMNKHKLHSGYVYSLAQLVYRDSLALEKLSSASRISVITVPSKSGLDYQFRPIVELIIPPAIKGIAEYIQKIDTSSTSTKYVRGILDIFNLLILHMSGNEDQGSDYSLERLFGQISSILFETLIGNSRKLSRSSLNTLRSIGLSSLCLGTVVLQHPLWCPSLNTLFLENEDFAIEVTETLVEIISLDSNTQNAGRALLEEMKRKYSKISDHKLEPLIRATSE